MLTIVAWIVFVPALIWNAVFFGIAFTDFMNGNTLQFKYVKNYLQAVVSLVILFVPGVYLFGWY
jgi:hypothetical protein